MITPGPFFSGINWGLLGPARIRRGKCRFRVAWKHGHGRGVALNLVPHTHHWIFRMWASAGVDRLKIDCTKRINAQIISPRPLLGAYPQNTTRLIWNSTRPVLPHTGDCKVPFEITADYNPSL